ncbi:hypothetical protein GCM10011529_05890 [Polymorphobacter glacialis]|uniref:Transglycosylase SLT domain-containing protein n=2 Tax=Sandarakinorhabdus glacialis TaxID=1614636 RepID=A0A916ZKI5_9SPHN|nr:hypothetical protein GCM10011529_05890 [Polymorphobacter glacialis]
MVWDGWHGVCMAAGGAGCGAGGGDVDRIEGLAGRVAGVVAAVRTAAARTGTDFSYLMAQARVESGLNPAAKARTSSAVGLYQFTNSTWLETVRKHGAEHGLGWAAEAISKGAAGAGSAVRGAILELREDAGAAALMAGEFAADNGAVLQARLGRAVGAADLYMAHFLGVGGAVRFLTALAETPGRSAASVVPGAAGSNRGVFFGRGGEAKSVGEVYARFEGKLEVSAGEEGPLTPFASRVPLSREGRGGGEVPLTPLNARALSRPLPQGERGERVPLSGNSVPVDRARLAYMLLAELGG